MRAIMLTAVVFLATLAHASPSSPPPPDPYVFERVRTAQALNFREGGPSHWMLPSLSLSGDGAFIAHARFEAIDVWSIPSGRRTFSRALNADPSKESPFTHVALMGQPCRAVISRSVFRRAGIAEQWVEIVACDSGLTTARIERAQLSGSLIEELTPLDGCGLVVVRAGQDVAVIDIGKGRVRDDLARLFAETTLVGSGGAQTKAQWIFARRPGADCKLYGVLLVPTARSDYAQPTKIYEFDLRSARARLAKALTYDISINGEVTSAWQRATISPSGAMVAIYVQRAIDSAFPRSGPSGVTDLIVADLQTDEPAKVFDMRELSYAIRDLAFLNERELILRTHAFDVGTVISLFDARAVQSHTLCNSDFTNWQKAGSDDQGADAIAVNDQLGAIGVVIEREVRLYRYRRHPAVAYAGLKLCKGY